MKKLRYWIEKIRWMMERPKWKEFLLSEYEKESIENKGWRKPYEDL